MIDYNVADLLVSGGSEAESLDEDAEVGFEAWRIQTAGALRVRQKNGERPREREGDGCTSTHLYRVGQMVMLEGFLIIPRTHYWCRHTQTSCTMLTVSADIENNEMNE